jgi:hypothetical protein
VAHVSKGLRQQHLERSTDNLRYILIDGQAAGSMLRYNCSIVLFFAVFLALIGYVLSVGTYNSHAIASYSSRQVLSFNATAEVDFMGIGGRSLFI